MLCWAGRPCSNCDVCCTVLHCVGLMVAMLAVIDVLGSPLLHCAGFAVLLCLLCLLCSLCSLCLLCFVACLLACLPASLLACLLAELAKESASTFNSLGTHRSQLLQACRSDYCSCRTKH